MFQKEKWKEMVHLALPVVISKLSFTMMGIVDTAMVGHLGAGPQAAAGFAVVYLFTLYVFGLGVITSVNTLVSQYVGAKMENKAQAALANGLFLALAIGTLTWISMVASKPVFHWMGMNPGVCEGGYTYLFYRSFGVLSVFGYWVYNSYFEGLGKTRIPMYVTLVANVMNMGLDYMFIFGFGPISAMGLKGAGLATAGSNMFMFAVLVYLANRGVADGNKLTYRTLGGMIQLRRAWQMLKLGAPMGAQMFLEVGAFLVFTTIVGWAGDVELAATQIAMRIMSVTFMTAWGISIAATTLVGKHQGEQRSDLAQSAIHRALLLIGVISIVLCVVMLVGKKSIVGLFTPVPEVSATVMHLIVVASLFAICDGISMVSYGALRGAGDTVWPLWNVSVMHWAIGIPMVYIFTISMGMGAFGNWLGMAIMMFGQASFMLFRVKSGKWKNIVLVQKTAR
ncbi:MAG: MATE family efflux transporter [Deltaproteobacteria bacterium]|nr:MATE family efflux transporter [Deltaproteobacteria bacterium]MBN2672613.1 MATE family efflux transporter [Deltaproteobacteria bacterium]